MLLTVMGCAGGRSAPTTAPAPSAPSAAEAEAIYFARQDSAMMRFTDADVDFMTGMIAHHAQALVMAALAPERTTTPSIRILTARIINAQRDEIATMQTWLRDRGQPVPEVRIDGVELMVHGVGEHHTHMPGMLTRTQLERLAAAEGGAFDRLFLEFMIQHHQGAVTMVHELFGTDGAGQDEAAFRLASDIQVDQLTEIARMERMIEALGARR